MFILQWHIANCFITAKHTRRRGFNNPNIHFSTSPRFCVCNVIGRLFFSVMPDITMCTNEDCPLSYSCWRFNCTPSQHQQSYAKFEPQIDEVLDQVECKMYLETPNNEKSDVVRLWG